jgi:hypothetical protein
VVDDSSSPTAQRVAALNMAESVVQALRGRLPEVATRTVAAIIVEVPSYTGALRGTMGDNIEAAVQMALGGFLELASHSAAADPSTPLDTTLQGAYALGRGEARSGRSMDALLAAYRVGARVAWREMAQAATEAGVGPETMARFAELVFAYIDELSAASVAGHTDELSTSGRVRARLLEELGRQLLAGARDEVLVSSADSAGWPVPRTLTAVLMPAAEVRRPLSGLGADVLPVGEDLPGLPALSGVRHLAGGDHTGRLSLLLVPEVDGRDRPRLLRLLEHRFAVVGPARPWTQARASYERAVRVLELVAREPLPAAPVDSERHLADLVVAADADALADLRTGVLGPLARHRPASAQRLAETLRSWLLHQGRREAVAADLHVHAQTVRYRMGQLRELYGDRLDDPRTVFELVLALHGQGASEAGRAARAAQGRPARP